FLVPVPGTRLQDMPPLPPLECLKIVAVYRFLLPRATIKVCAGRDRNLGDLASWIFYAGANGMMVGHYLTTAGRAPDVDLKMVRDLGFRPVAEGSGRPL
ncbi:MAG: biotin synthase BioB, partial [Candidatus Dadabacteria bacterium]